MSRNKITDQEIEHLKELEEAGQKKVNSFTKKIVIIVFSVLIISAIFMGIYIARSFSPVDKKDESQIEVTIPIGSGTSDIAQILEENGIVRNGQLYSYYLKFNNTDNLQAGYYDFSPSMTAKEVLNTLEAGGRPIFVDADTKITVTEGMQIDEIAQLVDKETTITYDEFMKQVNDKNYIESLAKRYPSLLGGILEIEGLKHPLEGYLFPATYEYISGDTASDLIEDMVAKANLEYQNLLEDLHNTYLTYHEVLTLASIIEKEGITNEDRKLISGVFYNRINAGMPLQSDITVLYALGEHKEFVTYKDLEVDSPYNLYSNVGLAPGPMNSPGIESIMAAIYPTANEYYYFVADLDTQKVYYSSTQEEHDQLVEEYVNKRQRRIESLEESKEQDENVESTEAQNEDELIQEEPDQ